MKCKACNGTGKIQVIDFAKPNWKDTEKACPICCGSGVIGQTNDEWRKTCSTEEFAEWISNLAYACMRCGMSGGEAYCHTGHCIQDEEDALEWLKQPHEQKGD